MEKIDIRIRTPEEKKAWKDGFDYGFKCGGREKYKGGYVLAEEFIVEGDK